MNFRASLHDRCRTVHVPLAVLDSLKTDAKKRGISPETLAFLIIETVAKDKLVGAILDDMGDVA
jgi:hypothetical protein